jgi:hypothetical protein
MGCKVNNGFDPFHEIVASLTVEQVGYDKLDRRARVTVEVGGDEIDPVFCEKPTYV